MEIYKGLKNHVLKGTVLVAISLIYSCNMSDYSEQLAGGYKFVSNGKDYNLISGKNQIYPNVIGYSFNDDYIIVCQEPNKTLYKTLFASTLANNYNVYCSYIKDSVSEKYHKSRSEILADSIIAKIFKSKNVSFENTGEDILKGEKIADSIIKNNTIQKKIFSLKKVYWIVGVKDNILFGPYSKDEFELRKNEKNIDLELNI